ncbi:MAG TPA: hypothetical protein VEZ90_09505 [Blastocatellia bacterium]|nr:hypothetical protein [Blastocatellia bacterium]
MASLTCQQCGLAVRPEDAFCRGCGTALLRGLQQGGFYASDPGGQPLSQSPSAAQNQPPAADPNSLRVNDPNQPSQFASQPGTHYPPPQQGQIFDPPGGYYPHKTVGNSPGYSGGYPTPGGYYPNPPGGYPRQPPAGSDVPVVAPYAAAPQAPGANYIPDPRYWIWRQGDNLIFYEGAQLPDRCIKCNEPTCGSRLDKKLSWVNPLLALLCVLGLIGAIVYVIVASTTRKTAFVSIGFCQRHLQWRRTWMWIGWALLLVGFAGLVLAAVFESWWTALAALVMLIASLVAAIVRARYVGLRKIENQYVWLKNVDQAYLAQFPPLA